MFERELDKALASNGRLIAAQEDAIAELRRRGEEIDRLRAENERLRAALTLAVKAVERPVTGAPLTPDRARLAQAWIGGYFVSYARAALKEPDHG